MSSGPVIGFVTSPPATAPALARELVETHFAACVNIIGHAQSFYWWEGKLHDDQQSLLVIKTTAERLSDIRRFLDSEHPDDVYELVVLPIDDGNPAYLDWLTSSVIPPGCRESRLSRPAAH